MNLPADDDQPDQPMAIRRHHDRCFHLAEEVTPQGYIVDGILIDHDDVAEALPMDGANPQLPTCGWPKTR